MPERFDRPWIRRAFDSKDHPRSKGVRSDESVRTASANVDGREILFPTIRLVEGELRRYPVEEAKDIALRERDFIEFSTPEEATVFSKALSAELGRRRDLSKSRLLGGVHPVFSKGR